MLIWLLAAATCHIVGFADDRFKYKRHFEETHTEEIFDIEN